MVHNNYYSCYYNNNPGQLIRENLFDKWRVHFDDNITVSHELKTLKQETLRTCELVYNALKEYTPKLNLFFSGGTDSECMLKCFVELKIPVNPIIIVHEHYPFSDETKVALYICNALNITPQIMNLNLHQLYATGTCHSLGMKYQTARMGMIELIYALEQIGEPGIIVDDITMNYRSSPGNLINKDETSKQQWFYEIKEDVDGLFDRYEFLTGIPVVADPFKYTPENWAALISAPNIKDIVFNERGKTSSNTTKNIMMSREFQIAYREKTNIFSTGHYKNITNRLVKDLSPLVFPAQIDSLEYSKLLQTLLEN
jgi:hypothetical protein